MDRARPVALLAALVAASSLTVGCTSTPAATSTPTPRPTFTCTPEAGGDGYPCTEADFQAMQAKDALYAEAEAVYRIHFAEVARIERDYRDLEITDTIRQTASGPYLASLELDIADLQRERITAQGDGPWLVYVRRSVGQVRAGAEIALEVCVDGSGLTIFSGGNKVGSAPISKSTVFFMEVDERLFIWDSLYSEVDAC